MLIRFIVFLFLTLIAFQDSFSDKVWLQNGDIISGRVVSLEGDILLLNSTIMNKVQIPWSSVQSIQTEKAVSVILKNGDRITAILSKNPSNPFVLKSELIPEAPLPKEHIHAIGVESNIKLQNDLEAAKTKIDSISNELHDSNIQIEELQTSLAAATEISQLWSGSVSLLGGFKTGNRESKDLFVTAEAIRETDDEKLTLRSDFGYGESEKVVDTTEGRVQSNIQVFFNEDYYVFGDLLLEHDRFEDLELRVDGTVGVGYRFWKTKESSLSMDLGVGGSQEIFRSGGSKTEGITRFSAEFSQILYGRTKLKQSLTVFPSVSELGDLRLISRTSLITPILNSLSWDLSIIDEFNTSPRNVTIKKNDVAVRTGLTYSF